MSKIKCITFSKDAQSKIPKDIREKMNIDRAKAQKEFMKKHGLGGEDMLNDITYPSGD